MVRPSADFSFEPEAWLTSAEGTQVPGRPMDRSISPPEWFKSPTITARAPCFITLAICRGRGTSCRKFT